jgi:dihydrolipoamide dehydrogenase
VATGRQPNVEQLNLGNAGIETDERGNIKVDQHFRTTAEGIFAIGDVTGQPAFTHVSWEDHRRLLDVLQNGRSERTQGDCVVGYAFFTEPQVGRVGMTFDQAQEARLDASMATLPLEDVTRAAATGHRQGFYRMVVDKGNGRILGATLVSPQAAELVHVFLALMEAGATWRVLERSQHIHPTYAEDLPTLARKFK